MPASSTATAQTSPPQVSRLSVMHRDGVYHLLATDADPVAVWNCASRHLETIGLDRIISFSSASLAESPEFRTMMPNRFIAHYDASNDAQDDPFLHYCLPSLISIKKGQGISGPI
jgi:hypothetical protein